MKNKWGNSEGQHCTFILKCHLSCAAYMTHSKAFPYRKLIEATESTNTSLAI